MRACSRRNFPGELFAARGDLLDEKENAEDTEYVEKDDDDDEEEDDEEGEEERESCEEDEDAAADDTEGRGDEEDERKIGSSVLS